MVREGSSPGSPGPTSPVVWALPALLTAALSAVAVALVSAPARTPVAWIGAAAFVAVALSCGEAARRGKAVTALRAKVAAQDEALWRQQAETVRLAETLLPDVVARLRKGEFPEDVLTSLEDPGIYQPGLTPEFRAAHHAVLRSVLDAVVAEEDLRDSAQRAFVNIARRVQAIVHQQAQELREMEDRHGQTPAVFGDLLRLDHGTALIGRLADSIAVLGGARPGRQWSKAVPLYSVLRGAMSRIIDYQRVELHSVSQVAVVGPAVEPLIHALAELLDNATRYSPPQTKVHLTAVDVNSGIAIEIEDGGLSMSEEARKRAERMLRQAQEGIDLTDLGETPRLGLAVVGPALAGVRLPGLAALLGVRRRTRRAGHPAGTDHHRLDRDRRRPWHRYVLGTPCRPGADRRTAAAVSARAAAAPGHGPAARREHGHGRGAHRDRAGTERTAAAAPQEPGDGAGEPAAAERTTAAAPDQTEAQPGMWLAAFQSGLSGDSQAGASQNTDVSCGLGEQGEQP